MKFELIILLVLVAFNGLCQPAPPGAPAVVITEIMYHSPQMGADDLEFIELRNPSDSSERSLAFHSFTQGIEFTFPAGLIVQPKEYILVAKDSVAFENVFGLPAFQWTGGDLDDAGETIMLKGNFNNVVDSVDYSPISPWPLEADGNGKSIVLCNDTLQNGGPTNWTAATNNTGIVVNGVTIFANPGADCSTTSGILEHVSSELDIYPNPNTGAFTLNLPSVVSTENCNLNINDLSGKVVYSETVTTHTKKKFSIERFLPPGVYVLSLQSKDALFQQRLVIME